MIYYVKKTVQNIDSILCQDDKYRSHPTFGTYPECAKEYRSKGWAEKRAVRERGEAIGFDPQTHEMRAYGVIVRYQEDAS